MKYFRFFIVYVLVQTLLINSASAANVGGWNLSNPISQGASTVYDATKNVVINGKNFIKDSSVKITPTASQVSKVLARGAAGYALSVAVEQLIGAVDWVLDPANNQIKYTQPIDPELPTYTQIWFPLDQGTPTKETASKYGASTAEAVCQKLASTVYASTYNKYISVQIYGTSAQCTLQHQAGPSYVLKPSVSIVANPNYDPEAQEQEEKTLPLDVVAQQVISNAAGGDVNAQSATTAAAADIVAEAETDNTKARPIATQAEANAETKPADEAAAESANDATGTSKPNTADPQAMDISLEFPVFCNWAPTVCEAAQVVISFPQTLTGWWESANQKADQWAASIAESWSAVKDWATQQEPEENTELEIPEEPQEQIDTDIAFSGQCPPDRSVPVNLGISTLDFTFSYQLTCQALDSAKPILLLVGAFLSALIIGGIKQ